MSITINCDLCHNKSHTVDQEYKSDIHRLTFQLNSYTHLSWHVCPSCRTRLGAEAPNKVTDEATNQFKEALTNMLHEIMEEREL